MGAILYFLYQFFLLHSTNVNYLKTYSHAQDFDLSAACETWSPMQTLIFGNDFLTSTE